MKKVFILLSGLSLSLFSCHEKHQESYVSQSPPQPTIVAVGAIGELPNWFNTFSDPVYGTLLDSIKEEYPHLAAETKFLDSIKGLKIDFIGVVHTSFGNPGLISDSAIYKCQCSIGHLMDTSKYLFVGSEWSGVQGKITWENLVEEFAKNYRMIVQLDNQGGQAPSIEVLDNAMRKYRKYDYTLDRLILKQQKPYFIGANPYWLGFTEGVIISYPNQQPSSIDREKLNEFALLLGRCRSEIALIRTAKELVKRDRNKKAVVIYGNLHLVDFQMLATQYGLTSKFIVLKECNVKAN